MAKVLGETGRYVSEQSTKKFHRIFLLLYLFGIGLGFAIGYIIGARKNYVTLLFLLTLPLVWKYLLLVPVEKNRSWRAEDGGRGFSLVPSSLSANISETVILNSLM